MENNTQKRKEKLNSPAYVSTGVISLFDIWLIFSKRKKFFCTTFLLATVAAVAFIFLVKPVYMSRAVIQVGRVGLVKENSIEAVPLEPPSRVVMRLQITYGSSATGAKRLPYLEKAMFKGKPEDGIVECYSRGHSPEEAMNFLANILNDLIQRHKVLYANNIQLQKKYFGEVKSQLNNLHIQEKLLEAKKPGASKGIEVLTGLLAIEDMRLQIEGLRLMKEWHYQQGALSNSYTWQTRYILKPVLMKRPVKPRPAFYLAIGMTLGLFLGLFCVFMTEFIVNSRRRMREVREMDAISREKGM